FSWRSNTLYNQFLVSFNYNRTLDSHMIKNTEWGAMSYLTNSDFGIDSDMNINNNSAFKTGYSSVGNRNQHTYPGEYGDNSTYNLPYNTEVGYLASTTGNITGIYDLNGGSVEYVSGYRSTSYGTSGFNSTNITTYNAKYFDVYNAASTATSYNYRILGDATYETSPISNFGDGDGVSRYHGSWYGDIAHFVDATNPWFIRSGTYVYGVLGGQFAYNRNTGAADIALTSRITLIP
ncbi:MAG: hypothetical protein PHQ64_04720, partial [Bacilli bacterium]|nr:hypothetical protein [Bacilli bacterium]